MSTRVDHDLRRHGAWRARRAVVYAAGCIALLAVGGCDSDVATSPYPSPTDFAIQGIDVSKYQGDVDWNAVAGSGVRFAWIKATEGGDYLDEKFRQNWELSRDAGIIRGAYHFAYWCRSAEEQAAWFLANVPNDPSALPPVLDVEWNPQSRTCPRKLPRGQALAMMKTILDAMEHAYGKRPVIYTSVDFHRDVLQGEFQDYPMWVRSVRAYPTFCGGIQDRHFWVDREDILSLIAACGFEVARIGDDEPDHKNGPAFSVLATRRADARNAEIATQIENTVEN